MADNPFADSSAAGNPFANDPNAGTPGPFAAAPPVAGPYAAAPAPPPGAPQGGFFAAAAAATAGQPPVDSQAPANHAMTAPNPNISTALVPSQQPSANPYGYAAAAAPPPAAYAPPPAYDPFGGPPAPVASQPPPPQDDFFQPPPQPQQQQQQQQYNQQQPPPSNGGGSYAETNSGYSNNNSSSHVHGGGGSNGNQYNNSNNNAPHNPQQESPERNKYSMELARQAPIGASPLPKAALVRKKGFVLARISFRTIVMKKWKQTFWVQYGPHTMLWFRTQADFDDWLNNPYHSQQQRNFLIKLAVNFVHDLYKPNVRGYQVTQCRTKGYGNKLVRQFKLERWMDYGPTIAAAFGSYDPKEVDGLREALVECMRNTPLNGGIRATGAVRQDHNQQHDDHNNRGGGGYDNDSGPSGGASYDGGHSGYDGGGSTGGYSSGYRNHNNNNNLGNVSTHSRRSVESHAEPEDLLDVDNWDGVPQQQLPYADPTVQYPVGGGAPPPYGAPPPQQGAYGQQQQQANPFGTAPPPQQQQQQQIGGYPAQPQTAGVAGGALVPVANAPSPYAYAGQQQQQQPYNPAWQQQQQQQPQQPQQQHGYAQQTHF